MSSTLGSTRELTSRLSGIKPRLRQFILHEWDSLGFFPCYAAVQPSGDPSFGLRDLGAYLLSPTDPRLRLAALAFWPARLSQVLSPPQSTGLAALVPTRGPLTLRFHTFFTNAYLYQAIRPMVADPALPQAERLRWGEVLSSLVSVAWHNRLPFDLDGEPLSVFQFFPRRSLHLEEAAPGARFLHFSGLSRIDPDADDTFVLLEMFADFVDWTGSPAAPPALQAGLEGLLRRPYWKLARRYQFDPQGTPAPTVNYTGVDSLGGVSTWFAQWPVDAPDLVVNANVLRGLIVLASRGSLLEDSQAVQVVRRIIAFLLRNIRSGLFRTLRGYNFYIPEFFYAMFARTWQAFDALDPLAQKCLDPHGELAESRRLVLAVLAQDLHPRRGLNPLDAALALEAAVRLGWVESEWIDGCQQVLAAQLQPAGAPYPAYEIFKGKLPTRMIYGSEAATAALVYSAIGLVENL